MWGFPLTGSTSSTCGGAEIHSATPRIGNASPQHSRREESKPSCATHSDAPTQSQNDPGEVGAWLIGLDQFTRTEVGALDLVLATHAGWNGERTRGSSALEDWADSIITMTRDDSED